MTWQGAKAQNHPHLTRAHHTLNTGNRRSNNVLLARAILIGWMAREEGKQLTASLAADPDGREPISTCITYDRLAVAHGPPHLRTVRR
jgi:hypothetical protein